MSENAEPWRIPGCNNTIKQEPTLKEAKIKGITLITEDLEQMDVNKFYEMSKDNKIRWILNKIGRYQDQINESANTHKIPPQLIAAVILNELIDIDWKDVVQQKIHLGGSIGISQIQIKTAVDHHLVIFPDDEQLIDKLALIAYAKHAANCGPPVGDTPIAVVPMIPPSDKFWRDGAESEIAEERLTIPQYAIEAAAREIALLIKNMTAHRENPWQKQFGFSLEDVNQLKSVNDIYKYILGKNQLEKEKNLAELIAAAYNSPEIVIAVKQESITRDSPEFKYRDAVPHGDNARDAAEALHAPDMSAMDLVEAIEKMGYINTITKNKIKNLLEKLKLEIIVHKSRPGQDNPDDNDNIARGSSPFSFVNRNSYMRAKKKNYSIVDSLFKNANVKNCLGYLIEYEDPFIRGALLDLSANFSSILENEISVESIGEEKSQSFIKAYASILNQWATIPDVAVLGAGDANGALALLANFREPATLVRPAISYDQLRQFCLLIIPTGALSDWHASKKFQKTMQEYTADGGKVLVLAQQFGKEYNALPGTIQAYGWAEDQSCQYASAQITAMIPAFCSMTKEKPDFNVDGYFYGYSPESTVWLTRTINEQPCMLSYSFGKGKIVMSTLYMDWAAENHQGTVDEGNFFRDLVASLLAPESVPVFSLKEKIRQKIVIVNTSSEEKLQIQPVLIDPRGDEVRLETISASIHPHRAEEFEIDMPLLDKPGYYQIAANVQTESGEALDDIYYGYRFVISSLPRLSDREKKDLSFSVQSDLENYVRGSTGKFTILVWNNSDLSRKIKVDYRFPQNSGASQNPQDYQGSQILEIPAGLDAKLDLSIKIVNKNGNDWLRAAFFDSLSGEKLGEASKGFFTKEPETRIELKTDRDSYEIGDRLRAWVSFDNPFANEQHCDLVFQIADSSGNSVCRLEFEEKVNAGINDFSFEFELPKEMISGRPILQVFIQMDGEMIGIGEATFDYVGPKLSYSGSISDRFSKAPISNAQISFYFGNQLFKAVAGQDGKFELLLPSAAYKVEASAEGYNLATADAIIYPRDNEPFTLLLVPVGQAINAGMVYGTTYDRTSNQRVPNLGLIFSKGEDVIEIKSDRRGDYSLSLESGDYRVRALKDGHTASNQFILRVVQGYKQQFDIYVAIGKFRLTAKDIITDEILTDLRVETFRLDQPLLRKDVTWEVNQGIVIQIGEGGRLALQVTKEGYLPLDTEIFASEIASDFVIYLTRIKHPFSITMADCLSDKAIDRVLLTIKKPDGTVVQTLETDLLGNCSGSLEAGRWLIEFEREGYHKIAAEFYHSARNSTPQTYYLKRISYPYQLQALDVRDEKPVPGVAIRICRPDGQDCREGRTDPNGFFSLDLPEARWLVNLKKELYSEQKTEIFHSIQGNGPDPFYLYPDPQAAQGKLKIQCLDYLSEQPLADSKVTVKSLTTGFELSDKTDRDGKVAVAIPDGRVEVSLERKGYAAHKTEILFAHQIAAEQRFYLVPDCSNYRLEVRNILSNQAIENVSVILVSGDQKMALGKTDKDGRIILNIPRGRQRLAFELEGYETLDTEFFNSGTSKALEQDIETVYLTRTREKYAGQVRDSSGKGIESVSLVFQQDSDVQSVTSDSEGRFIALLKYGKYGVILSRSGYREQKTQVFFGRHESILQTFYMYRMEEAIPADPGRLDLRVYDALTGRPLLKFSAYSGGWTEGQNGQVEFQRNFGNWECAVKAEGYHDTGSFFPTAFPGKGTEQSIFLFQSEPESILRLNVEDLCTGEPLGKARIQIDNGPVLSANARGIFTYQGKGHFKVIWIRAGLPGYNENILPYYIINGRKSLQFTIPLEEKVENGIGGLIVETLSHDDQKPIQDAAVFLYAEDTEFAAKTDHLGQAVFKDLRAGIYSISVQKTGFVIHEGKAKVQGEQLNKTILKMYPLRTQKILSPFNPRPISIPDELSIAPGEKKELAVCIQNFGEVSGKAKVLLDIPGFSRDNKILVLGPGEIKETAFEIDLPNDAISASFPFRVQVNGNSIKGLINVLARQFHVQAWMEDQTYSEGSLAALNLEISLEGHTSSMPLQLRVNWNDFSTTRDFVLEGGRAALKVDDIPVRFTGNKLLYGLYYPTGRSIYLNAIYIHRGGKTQAVPDKQQYRAGDRVKLQITGDPNEILMLSCPLWKGAAEIKLSLEGRAEYEFALPGRMLTGSYQIDVPDKIAIPIDVRGMEMTIKGKKIEILPESEKAHISWNALTNQPMDCAWRLERRLLMENIEIASGSLTVNEGLEEQRIAVPLAQIEDASHLSLNISAKTEQDWETVAVLDFNLD